MEYHTAVITNIQGHITTWINVPNTILSKRSHTYKNTFYVTSFEL